VAFVFVGLDACLPLSGTVVIESLNLKAHAAAPFRHTPKNVVGADDLAQQQSLIAPTSELWHTKQERWRFGMGIDGGAQQGIFA
jgi:hypothetical protein